MHADSLKIIEIYTSIQGESSWSGLPCTFVRLAGCDLRCRWCDSAYTFSGGERMSLEAVVDRVRALDVPVVEVTGGEPMLQPATPALCQRLVQAGFRVLIETGGHHRLNVLDSRVVKIVDVKCPGSGEAERGAPVALADCGSDDEVKFVLADRADYEWAVPRARELAPRVRHVLFSPVWGELSATELAEWILADHLPVRLNLQQHKFLWGEEPGR